MSGETNPAVSLEEFHTLQLQMLELREENHRLEEERKRQKPAEQKATLDDFKPSMPNFGKMLPRGLSLKNREREEELAAEVEQLRLELSTQESEFRLQQSTLMEELNKVVRKADALEAAEATKGLHDAFDGSDLAVPDPRLAQIPQLQAQLEAATVEAASRQEEVATVQAELRVVKEELGSEKESSLALRGRVTAAESALGELDAKGQGLREERAAAAEATKALKAELSALNEKFRRKQESYVALSREKEAAYEDFKKRLDSVVQKKDAESELLHKQITQMRHDLKAVDTFADERSGWAGEKASLESGLADSAAKVDEIRQLNETLQIQLQETHSANDVISQQLEVARKDVEAMQTQADSAEKSGEKRKALVEEMAGVLEKAKEDHAKELAALKAQHQEEQNEAAKALADAMASLTEMDSLRALLATEKSAVAERVAELGAVQTQLEECQASLVAATAAATAASAAASLSQEELRSSSAAELEAQRRELESALAAGAEDGRRLLGEREALARELQDKDDQLKAVEKKHAPLMKDLKRQVQAEKKRADRLQEKCQELLSEINRNSPGFEEIKSSECLDVKHANDTGSISGWSVVSGNGRQRTSSHQSNGHDVRSLTGGGDNESTCSTRDIEMENQELIARLTALQKANFELSEKVSMLEESGGAMADDIVKKSDVIHHYVRDRAASSSAQGSLGEPRSPAHSEGIRRVLDGLKMDLSAPDIRQTNRALQLMLEEALTKNIQQGKDMDLLSQEVARLTQPK